MGLDNGIVLEKNEKFALPSNAPPFETFEYVNGDYAYEVCYWRKWWGLRDMIVEYLGSDADANDTELELKDIAYIYSLFTEEITEEYCDTLTQGLYSDTDSIKEIIQKQKKNLQWLLFNYQFLKDQNIQIIFYDSY